ncbi:MAG: Ppx/GppA family phosphatase [Hyphomicrobiales bacterium]|nr:Ppx/GppA family phosphatase [Hyphomicrobiales bacterium]
MNNLKAEKAQGRLTSRQPVAVIDIGSNSVRQVIYEGLTRAPAVLFNEKVLCGLGKGLADNGRMDDNAVDRSLNAIRRFRALSRQVGVSDTFIVATAATRDAENGPEFVKTIEEICNRKVEVLTGEMEAHYTANGISSGFHNPAGIVGDIGGGSLELALAGAKKPKGQTFPLGGLQLRDLAKSDLQYARKIATKHIKKCELNWCDNNRIFYAIGGTWRSLAKLHLNHNNYPLQVIHHYKVNARELVKFCNEVVDRNVEDISGIASVSKNRRSLLQYGAIVLAETLTHLNAEDVLMSSLGVREGYLYSRLNKNEREKDALLEAAWELAVLRARSPAHSSDLAQWTGEAFNIFGIDESKEERRYRIAACYLADIGWRAHPDYRATQSLGIISNAGFVSISHEGRAYLSLANFYRYQGLGQRVVPPPIAELAGERITVRARILAGLFRLGYLYSASTPGILEQIKFVKDEHRFLMNLPEGISDLSGERPDLRLRQLAREANIEIAINLV